MSVVVKTCARGSATFSADGMYRYILTRTWEPGERFALWIMLNPSIADHERDDMTITKCIEFSKRWGMNALAVVNLAALISTKPKKLLQVSDPIGPDNMRFVRDAGKGMELVIAAWGALSNAHWSRFRLVIGGVKLSYPKMRCLEKTKSGAPHHPSRIGYNVALEDWP